MDCAYVPAATRSIRSVITLTVVLVVISALMLDPETDTYSLLKFQFYLWTFAVVLGYSYLSLVRSLIQGAFEFSDVPTDLPGILIVSVGTAVISTGVTSAVGSKGAGRSPTRLGRSTNQRRGRYRRGSGGGRRSGRFRRGNRSSRKPGDIGDQCRWSDGGVARGDPHRVMTQSR